VWQARLAPLRAFLGSALRLAKGGPLLRCLRRYQPCLHLTRHGVCNTQPAAQVFEHAAEFVQHGDHLGARIHDALESPPLADKAEGLVPRLDQTSAEKTLERRSRLAMRFDELLFVAGFHSETHHVEAVMSPLLVIPISTSKIQECASRI